MALTVTKQMADVAPYKEALETYFKTFVDIIDLVDALSSNIPIYTLSDWLAKATRLSDGLDDYLKDMFQICAKAQITTWGSIQNANNDLLTDYSNRQWSGVTGSLYKKRWQTWFEKVILTQQTLTEEDWFRIEWDWVLNEKPKETHQPLPVVFERIKEIQLKLKR
jgi:hypothetical protein